MPSAPPPDMPFRSGPADRYPAAVWRAKVSSDGFCSMGEGAYASASGCCIVVYARAGGGTGDAAMPCSGHCTVPCGVPDEEEVADAPPAPSAPMPLPVASPDRVSSSFGFTGAGPDLRQQMNA
jgi:hypothetical protein